MRGHQGLGLFLRAAVVIGVCAAAPLGCRRQHVRTRSAAGLRIVNDMDRPVTTVAYRVCEETGAFVPLPASSLAPGGMLLFPNYEQPDCFDLVALDAQQAVVGTLPAVHRGAASTWLIH